MENHIVKSFAPGGEFTRHSEGAFLRMKDGGIYFAYSRFTESGSDAAPSNLISMVSYDEGETWDIDNVICDQEVSGDLGYPASVELENGDILTVFYAREFAGGSSVIKQVVWNFEKE